MNVLSWVKEKYKQKRDKKFWEEGLTWDELTEEEKKEFKEIYNNNKKEYLNSGFFIEEDFKNKSLSDNIIGDAKFFKRGSHMFWIIVGDEVS